MTAPPVVAPTSHLLPRTYLGPEILSVISSDGQVYATLPRDRGEVRVESWEVARVLADDAEPPDLDEETYRIVRQRDKLGRLGRLRRARGRDWPKRVVRHLVHERRRCRDCRHEEPVVHFVWATRRCTACWSANVDVLRARVVPERPLVLRNSGEPFITWHNAQMGDTERHTWGRKPDDDARVLRLLSGSYRGAPDGHRHLYLLLRFGETLLRLPQYADDDTLFNLQLNVGNVAWRYFRLTGSAEAARATLDLFEGAAALMAHPVPVSLAKHSFGMATIDVLATFDEANASVVSGRADLRERAVGHLRDAVRLLDDAALHDPDGAERQRPRMLYALADLLSRGNATAADRGESLEIFDALPADRMGGLTLFVRAAQARARLLSPLPDDRSEDALGAHLEAARVLTELMRDDTPLKLKHRWQWALEVGQFLTRIGEWAEARPWLESAVSFIQKDTAFQTDVLTATTDCELYHRAFSLLAANYTPGWWFEALSLLETYRGRVIELAALDEDERARLRLEAEQARKERYFRTLEGYDTPTATIVNEKMWEDLTGKVFGPFDEDYELPGLSEQLLALFDRLRDEATVLISLSVDDTTFEDRDVVSAVLFGPPVTPPRKAAGRVWTVDKHAMQTLTSELHRRPGSFREARLRQLGRLAFRHLIAPIREDLETFACRRALLVTPSGLSNLPFEAFSADEIGARPAEVPLHFAFTPSFMFRAGRLPRRRDCASDRLLIIGYEGADLPHADREASVLRAMFGDRAHYLRGLACTKKRVVEELCGEYGFVHFICHATYDTERPHESSLYFRDSHTADAYRLRANEIREFVRFKDDPVVTLSACSTALTADSRSNTWHGLPGSLLESGARCIIGTRWPVADRVAEEMMGGLYELMLTSDRSPAACLHALQDQLRDRRPVEEWSCFGYLGTP